MKSDDISYDVSFPRQESSSITWCAQDGGPGLLLTECIGGDIGICVNSEELATVHYVEDLTPDFILEGYTQRAKAHAESVVAQIVKAAQNQAADNKGFEIKKEGSFIMRDTPTSKCIEILDSEGVIRVRI